MSKASKHFGQCSYCGVRRAETEDHIPPRNLFAKDNRADLVRVPSCLICNTGASKDDEYFRNVLVMRDDIADKPAARAAREAMLRSLARPEQRRLREATLRNRTPIEDWTGGLYRGQRSDYYLDIPRLERIAERVVRGLYWQKFKEPIGQDCGVSVLFVHESLDWDLDGMIACSRLADIILRGGVRDIGGGVAEYSCASTDAPGVTAWLLRFYESAIFFAFTAAKSDLDRIARHKRLKQSLVRDVYCGLRSA